MSNKLSSKDLRLIIHESILSVYEQPMVDMACLSAFIL